MQTGQGVLGQLDQDGNDWRRVFTVVEQSGDGELVNHFSTASAPSEHSSRESTSGAGPRSPTPSSWCSSDMQPRTISPHGPCCRR